MKNKYEKSNFENLKVWNKSVDLCVEAFRITEKFPKSEQFGIVNQIRRCSISIPSNIAEGAERQSKKEFMQFISIAIGSLSELKTQLIISGKVGFIEKDTFVKISSEIMEIHKMLNGLRKNLKNSSNLKLPT